MIETLDEVLSGNRINLHGDIDIQLMTHADGLPRMVLYQSEDSSSAPDETVVMDAHQIAHLARVLRAVISHGGDLNSDVASPKEGG